MTEATDGPRRETVGPAAQRDQEQVVRREMEEYYRVGSPPWDTGVAPPELAALVEGADALTPGRALELGCGTGTNAVYLARHGWEVAAVDLVALAVDRAREKADRAGVDVRFACGDATRLDGLDLPGPYDLFFDLSCYCGIPAHRRDAYAQGLTRSAAPGARLLMFGFGYGCEAFPVPGSGVDADELRTRFTGWELVDVAPGTNEVPTAWYSLRRDAGAGGSS